MNKNINTECLFLDTVVPITQQAQQTNIHMHRALALKSTLYSSSQFIDRWKLFCDFLKKTTNQGLEGMTPY